MEHDLPVRRVQHIVALLLILCSTAASAGESRTLVLVCRTDSPVSALSAADVRKAYMGAPLTVNGQHVQPVRNQTEALLDEVFLQKVVFLSGPSYERQVLSRVFRLGGQKPETYERIPELLLALRRSPGAVTYMWADTATRYPDIRVVATLWTGNIE